MFNRCDDSVITPGQCDEAGIVAYLGEIQRWRENNVSDATTYATLARQELEHFLNGTGGRVFGRCPCTTGNVTPIDPDEVPPLVRRGQRRQDIPEYQAYADTDSWVLVLLFVFRQRREHYRESLSENLLIPLLFRGRCPAPEPVELILKIFASRHD